MSDECLILEWKRIYEPDHDFREVILPSSDRRMDGQPAEESETLRGVV